MILRKKIKNLIPLMGLIAVTSCYGCAALGTYNPATGRNELIWISTPEEISLGENIHQELLSQFKLSGRTAESARVRQIGERVAKASDRQDYDYQFFLIEEDELNAFTVPGGRIYLYTGLIDKLTTDDQIASVLAHEIGHCAARHTVKKYQAALGYDLIGRMVLSQVGEGAQQVASLSSGVIMKVVFSSYGRKDEYEADRLGIKYMDRSGYDPAASVETLQVLMKDSGDGGAPLMLRSHPYLSDRITAARKEIDLLRRNRPAGR